ncbi:MAG: cysteine peptidase family C39 domain-containing protein [Phycisphaerales bacterium]|nr:cysteine peptidase family C39 domain-containing protein [Phycisphaerales bacterium]
MASESANVRVTTPSILQMQPTECGVVSLAILLAHHGRWVSTAELRRRSGLDGNGLTISGIARTAQAYELEPHVFRCPAESITDHPMPVIAWWQRRHFLVIEGRDARGWLINDPEGGHRHISHEAFEAGYSGMILQLVPTDKFEKGGRPPSTWRALKRMLGGAQGAFAACGLASIANVPLQLAMAGFLTYFIDRIMADPAEDRVRPFLLAVGIVVLLRAILTFIQSQTELRIRSAAGIRIEVDLLQRVLDLSDPELTLRLPGDVQQRLSVGRSIAGKAVSGLAQMPAKFLTLLVFGTAVYVISPPVAVGVVIASISGFLIVQGVKRLLFELNTRLQRSLGAQRSTMFSGLSSQSWLAESGSIASFLERWTGELAESRSLAQHSARARLFASSGRGLIDHLVSQVATLVFGGLGVIAGTVTIGELAALQLLVGHLQGAVGSIIGFAQTLPIIRSDIARVDDIMDCEPRLETTENSGTEPLPSSGIEFRNVPVSGLGTLSGRVEGGSIAVVEGVPDQASQNLARRLAGRSSGPGSIAIAASSSGPDGGTSQSTRIIDGNCPLFSGTYEENLCSFDARIPTDRIWSALEAVELADRFEAHASGLSAQVRDSDGFSRPEEAARLEIATALIVPPLAVIVTGGLATFPEEKAAEVLKHLAETGAAVLVLEQRIRLPEDHRRLVVEPLPTSDGEDA